MTEAEILVVHDATVREVIDLILKVAAEQPDNIELSPKVVLQIFATQLAKSLDTVHTVN